MITQHRCAVLLNKDTLERDYTCTPIQVLCSLTYSSWAVEGMVVTGKLRRAPDPSCSYFTLSRKEEKEVKIRRKLRAESADPDSISDADSQKVFVSLTPSCFSCYSFGRGSAG